MQQALERRQPRSQQARLGGVEILLSAQCGEHAVQPPQQRLEGAKPIKQHLLVEMHGRLGLPRGLQQRIDETPGCVTVATIHETTRVESEPQGSLQWLAAR